MPDITITPGTFNPPGTLAVVHGLIDFPKTPVQQVRRPFLQYNSRWVQEEVVVVDGPIIANFRDYFTGECGSRFRDEDLDAGAASVTVSGNRYIPDGTYAVTSVINYHDFALSPWARSPGTIDLGDIDVQRYFVTGEFGTFGSFCLRIPYSVDLIAAADGAAYEIEARYVSYVPGAAGVFEIFPFGTQEFEFEFVVTRDGLICDRVFIDLEINANINFLSAESEVATIEDSITYVTADFGLPETLYGGQAIVPVIEGPAGPIVGYRRLGASVGGTLTIA